MRTNMYPCLYQINTRVWLNELSNQLGRRATFYDVSDEFLDELVARGFDWFWPLGVWQTGRGGWAEAQANPAWQEEYRKTLPELREADIVSSPFAIVAYRVNEDYGGADALTHLRTRLQRRGVRLLLDFVPNHTALDHQWVHEHPEYYVAGTDADLLRDPQNYALARTRLGEQVIAHGKDPYFPGWSDTFQLNYRSHACREAMAAQLLQISDACDAVRCDMAMLLLPDVIERTWGKRALPSDGSAAVDRAFWPEAITAVRTRRPDFVFMAEVYWDREWDLQKQGFDYTYDKRLYDRLCSSDAASVRGHLRADPEYQRRSVRFLENHDEPRAAATFPTDVHRAAASIAFLVPGMRFFYEGELEGRRVRVPMQLGRRPDEPLDERVRAFYGELLALLKSPIVRSGAWKLLDSETAWTGNPTAEKILGFAWTYENERLLVAVNYGPTQAQCYLRLPWSNLKGADFRLQDQLSGVEYARSGDDLQRKGLYLDMPAWQSQVFRIERL